MVNDDGIPLAGTFLASVFYKCFAFLGVIKKVEIHLECISPFLVCAILELDNFREVHWAAAVTSSGSPRAKVAWKYRGNWYDLFGMWG